MQSNISTVNEGDVTVRMPRVTLNVKVVVERAAVVSTMSNAPLELRVTALTEVVLNT